MLVSHDALLGVSTSYQLGHHQVGGELISQPFKNWFSANGF